MSDEETENKVIHEIDGIQEYDNKLPNWWLYTLYGAIAFAVVYWFHYQISGFGDLPRAELQHDNDKAAAVEAARIKAAGVLTPEALAALARDKVTVEQGKQVFTKAEWIVLAVFVVGAVYALMGLVTGYITI